MGSFSDAWREAGQDDDFDPDDGGYQVRIVDAGAFMARTDGREWCKVRLQIIGGDEAGRQFDDFGAAGDHNPKGLRIMRSKLTLYGLDPEGIESIEDLDNALRRDLVGNVAEITVKHKDGYRNISVQSSVNGRSDIPTDDPEPKAKKAFTVPGELDPPF